MEEKRRVTLWAITGCLLMVPMAVTMVSAETGLGQLLIVWSLFVCALVLLGMALVGLLMLKRRSRLFKAGVPMALGAALVLLLVIDGMNPGGSGMSIWGFMSFMALSYLLMALWQVLLDGVDHGLFTDSAYLDAAAVNLVLSIIVVNAVRSAEVWPDNAKSIALILAFAMLSTVLSFSDLYSRNAATRGSREWIRPVAFAVLLGFIMPFIGVLVMLMTQGFSAPSV